MEIVDSSQVFNEEFYTYIKKNYTNYLNKLLEFSIKKDEKMEETIAESVQSLQEAILENVISTETEEDYETDIDDVRKEKVESILYNINNYLISLTPSEAVKELVYGNHKTLITKADIYTNSMIKKISDKMSEIKTKTGVEYRNYRIYREALDNSCMFLGERCGFTLLYNTMSNEFNRMSADSPLFELNEYIDKLLIEANILSKFDEGPRSYASLLLDKALSPDEDEEDVYNVKVMNKSNAMANICDSLLMNYTLLSLFSNKPEKIKISNKMLQTIMFEVNNGTITKDDLESAIEEGPIKFTEEEKKYIRRYFVNRIFSEQDKVALNQADLIKLVK